MFVFIFLKKRFVFGAVKLSMSSLCGVITVLGRRTATVIMHYQNISCWWNVNSTYSYIMSLSGILAGLEIKTRQMWVKITMLGITHINFLFIILHAVIIRTLPIKAASNIIKTKWKRVAHWMRQASCRDSEPLTYCSFPLNYINFFFVLNNVVI